MLDPRLRRHRNGAAGVGVRERKVLIAALKVLGIACPEYEERPPEQDLERRVVDDVDLKVERDVRDFELDRTSHSASCQRLRRSSRARIGARGS